MTRRHSRPAVVTKRLVYVFEKQAWLPNPSRVDLIDGIYFDAAPDVLLQSDDRWDLMRFAPRFSLFFRDNLHRTTLNVDFHGRNELSDEGLKSEEYSAKTVVSYALLAAMISNPDFAMPIMGFVTIPQEGTICQSFECQQFAQVRARSREQWTPEIESQIGILYHAVKETLSAAECGRLSSALKYYQLAFRAATDVDWMIKYVGMMMAMESLFSQGGGLGIQAQVSERAASMLATTADERQRIFRQVKSYYSLRSKLAHGGSAHVKQDGPKFDGLLLILQASLTKILSTPSLFTLFRTANNKRFNDELDRLFPRITPEIASS